MKSRLRLPLLVVLTIAGYGYGVHGSVPDVPTGQWMPGGSLAQPRESAVSVALDDGRVLVIGGRTAAGPVATVEALNADGLLTVLPSMSVPRVGHTAVLLGDGSVLVAGGTTTVATDQGTVEAPTSSAEIFAPGSNTWSEASPLSVARTGHTATALADGRLLVAGGIGEQGRLDSMEVFEPDSASFRAGGVLSAARSEAAAAVAGEKQVLVVGGRNTDGVLATADLVDVESGAVAQVTLTSPRAGASATRLIDGTVFVAGGNNGENDLATAEVIDPASGTSSPAGSMSQPRRGHQATLLDHNATVLIVGGTSNGAVVASADTFVPWTNQFAATNSPAAPRTNAIVNSTSTEGVAVLAGGKASNGALVAPAELYGFATVKTDRDDYSPGMFVTITGSGWQPGEVVQMVLHETGPGAEPDLPLIATADAAGRIFNDIVGINEGDLGRRFYLTAIGAGSTVQTTFTDAQAWALTIGPTSVTTSSNTSFTLSVTNNSTTGNGNDPMACVVLTVPSAFTASGTPTLSVPAGLTGWSVARVGNTITAKTNASAQRLPGSGAELTVTFQANAPLSTVGSPFVFSTEAFGNINCTGGSFPAPTSGQPTVAVTAAANATISGTVYNDANGNGVLDGDETGISGVAVTRSGTGTTTTTTDGSGAYTFSDLAAETYSVDYTVPPGFANTGAKPLSVTVAAGATSTGNNFFAAPQYTVTFQQSGLGGDTGSATIVTVNGTLYPAASLPTLTFTAGQSVTYTYENQVTVSGKRYVLTTPPPAPSSPFNVSGNTTVTGTYKTQYRLMLATSPSGIGTAPNPSASPSSTDGFYDSGTDVTVTALTPVAIDATSQYRFDHWSGDASGSTQPASVSMTAARAVTANYVTQYQVMFKQMGIGGDTGTAVVLTVGSTTFAAGDLPDTQYWDTGTTWTFGSPIATGSTDKRYRLTSTASGTITSAGTITGTYVAQYLLTLNTSPSGVGGASNPSVSPSSTDGFYDDNTKVYVDALALVAIDATSRYRFDHWSGDATGNTKPVTVFMTAGRTVTANYVKQYQIAFSQTGIPALAPNTGSNPVVKVGSVNYPIGALPFPEWYDENTEIAYSFYSPISTDPDVTDKQFELTNGAGLPSSPLKVTEARTITGQYAMVTYSILYHQPIDQSSSSMERVNSGKNGRVIPVKIEFFKNGTPVQTGTVLMKVNSWSCNGSEAVDPVSEYADAGSSNANTNLFRWSAGAPGFWIYNLDTGGLGLKTNACYRLDVYLNATTGSSAVKLSSSIYAVFKPVK
jgi:hypothetical protein